MFDAQFFAAMKDDAFFINIGRGESVVTADLTAALQAGSIGGAGLDVTDPEPLPPGHPLWSMSNVIITPHIATSSDFRSDRTVTLVAENVRRYVRGDARAVGRRSRRGLLRRRDAPAGLVAEHEHAVSRRSRRWLPRAAAAGTSTRASARARGERPRHAGSPPSRSAPTDCAARSRCGPRPSSARRATGRNRRRASRRA